ncbi:hypothetical protein HY993_03680 [Candidatus Micrarchaeota archaeon]|nr:hypothetical protein [Candidatus Micrarchaeota archaeon]
MIEQAFGAAAILFTAIASSHYYSKTSELMPAAAFGAITSLVIVPAAFFFLNVLLKIPLNAMNAGLVYLLAGCLFIFLAKSGKQPKREK